MLPLLQTSSNLIVLYLPHSFQEICSEQNPSLVTIALMVHCVTVNISIQDMLHSHTWHDPMSINTMTVPTAALDSIITSSVTLVSPVALQLLLWKNTVNRNAIFRFSHSSTFLIQSPKTNSEDDWAPSLFILLCCASSRHIGDYLFPVGILHYILLLQHDHIISNAAHIHLYASPPPCYIPFTPIQLPLPGAGGQRACVGWGSIRQEMRKNGRRWGEGRVSVGCHLNQHLTHTHCPFWRSSSKEKCQKAFAIGKWWQSVIKWCFLLRQPGEKM